MKHFTQSLLLAIFITSLALTSASGQLSVAVPAIEFSKVRQEAFDKVWGTINEKHYDPKFGGVDWVHIREIYLPKAKAAKSDQDFHSVLRQMLGETKALPFQYLPAASGTWN